jgi:hypothetical protein
MFDLTFDVGDIPVSHVELELQRVADAHGAAVPEGRQTVQQLACGHSQATKQHAKTKKLYNVGPLPPFGE